VKVAIISDIHGNYHAFEAVLDDIAHEHVDQIICAGDVVNPFLRSLDVWLKLKELKIPILRGNHEDYIVSYFEPGDRPEISQSVQFIPVQIVARHLGCEIAAEFKELPFDKIIRGPGGDELYICHASPEHNARSYIRGVDEVMAPTLTAIRARTIVAGHIHNQWSGAWRDKSLIIAGSVGLPHSGKPRPEYVIMAHEKGQWTPHFKSVAYDVEAALREYRESGCLERGGPVAWMLYDEILCAEARLAHFLPRILNRNPKPVTLEDWKVSARAFLEEKGARHLFLA
jgi:predicted phosphodiesterase